MGKRDTEQALGADGPVQFSVDRSSPVPLYFQLSQQLEAAIEHGRLTPGSLLGNEIELAGRLGLSRPTVRQAIQSLVDKGLLVRRRGIGTQVVHSQVKRPLELSSLYDDLEAAGQRPATRVLLNTITAADAEVAAALGSRRGREVRRVERLRLAHDEPIAYLLQPSARRPDRAEDRRAGGDRSVPPDAVGRDHPAQRPAVRRGPCRDREEGERLDEPEGAPLLTMQRTTFDDTGRAVDSARMSTAPPATPSSSSCWYGPEGAGPPPATAAGRTSATDPRARPDRP